MVGEVEVHRAFEPLGRAVPPGAADDSFEPVRIPGDRPGVNDDESAASREKLVQVRAVCRVYVPRFLLVEDQDIGLVQLSLCGERFGTGRLRAPFVQQRHPLFEEPRVIMRARAVRLRP